MVFAASLVPLAGCTPCTSTLVPVPEYVKVPDSLLASYQCGGLVATNGELLEAYAECVESSAKHHADKDAIRKLGTSQ